MKYRVIERKTCRVCGSERLTQFLELPNMPLTDELLRADQLGSEFLYPIRVYFCENCFLTQTLHDVDMHDYYRDYRYTVALSPFAQRFMRRLAEQVWRMYRFEPGDVVIEVGSGDGAQLRHFRDLGARVFGFEPSAPLAQIARSQGIEISPHLFGDQAEQDIPRDALPVQIVLLTYTFDHLPDPIGFLSAVKRVLDPERGILVIEVHNLEKIIARREFCLFEHEHTSYYTAATMQTVLRRVGFELISIDLLPESERRGNSLLAVATLQGSRLASRAIFPRPPASLECASSYVTFGNAIQSSLDGLRAFIHNRRARGIRLAGYGAGGRGVMTLAAITQPGDFAYVCDKNPAFHNRYTPGAHVPVVSTQRLVQDPVNQVIVFSFGYFDEIYDELAEFRTSGGQLISLLDLLKEEHCVSC